MDTLEEFCSSSGLRMNTFKSKAMCSRMVKGERKREIQDISTIKFVADLGHYLGFPLVQGRVSRNVYNDVVDKVSKRLATWKGNILSIMGRVQLVKSIIHGMLVYSFHVYLWPRKLPKALDRWIKKIWEMLTSAPGALVKGQI